MLGNVFLHMAMGVAKGMAKESLLWPRRYCQWHSNGSGNCRKMSGALPRPWVRSLKTCRGFAKRNTNALNSNGSQHLCRNLLDPFLFVFDTATSWPLTCSRMSVSQGIMQKRSRYGGGTCATPSPRILQSKQDRTRV